MGDGLKTGQKITTWALGQKGKQVGKGECWDLANEALQKAGALGSAALGPMDNDADYVWGDAIPDLKDVAPGDVLQFRDYVVTREVVTESTWADGAEWTDESERAVTRAHHTAIVAANQGNGILTIYEQNVEPLGRVVQLNTLNTKDLVPVTKRLKKKMERRSAPRKGVPEMADVVETTTIEVSGKIWAYRPKLAK
jgi:ABC-type taurine transport system substrate-binding protein